MIFISDEVELKRGEGKGNPLHVGDVVEIKYIETLFRYRYAWISDMDKFKNTTTIVKEVFDDEYVVLENCHDEKEEYYLFHFDWLDKLNKEELEETVLEDEDLQSFLGGFVK